MQLKLSYYQCKMNYFISTMYYVCKPYDNHKANTYSRFTKDKERRNIAYHLENHQFTKVGRNRGENKEENYKTARKY